MCGRGVLRGTSYTHSTISDSMTSTDLQSKVAYDRAASCSCSGMSLMCVCSGNSSLRHFKYLVLGISLAAYTALESPRPRVYRLVLAGGGEKN